MHYRRWARSEGIEVAQPWNERKKANYLRRKALKLQLPADDIRPIDVFERDGWICGICDEQVSESIPWPDPLSPSLDHVIPLSKGGSHTFDNVQLAHLFCNISKGDSLQVDAMSA